MKTDKIKRINEVGMFSVVDTFRTISKDMLERLDEFAENDNSIKVLEMRNDLVEMVDAQLEYLDKFQDNKEWEIRDNGDAFDK